MRKIVLVSLALFLLLALTFFYQWLKFNDGKLHLVFCNVGQGDGIFIRSPKGLDIVVDSGPDDSMLSCLSNNMPFWDRTIELALLTHPHADHMRGFISIFKRYKVLNFATEELSNDTVLYRELLTRVRNEKLEVRNLFANDTFRTRDEVIVKILHPTESFLLTTSPGGKIGETKEFASLILLVNFGEFDLILTGDSQIEGLKEALRQLPPKAGKQGLPTIEVLQVPHHGSRFGLDSEIVQKLNPKLAIISVGKNNYGHPSKEVIKILRDSDIKILRTDEKGDIEIIADKNGKFSVRQWLRWIYGS